MDALLESEGLFQCDEFGFAAGGGEHIGDIDQSQIGFVHQCGGLKRVFAAFGVEMPSRDAFQLMHHQGSESVLCAGVTIAPGPE